jgi:hypothetical protein
MMVLACLHGFGQREWNTFSDPLGIFGADLTDPQTLNLYSYVRNNPVTLFDPTGMQSDGGDDDCDVFNGCFGIGLGFGVGGGPEPPVDKQPPIYLPPDNGPNVNPPTGATDPNDPFSGETFGIPNGMNVSLRSLAGILLPPDTGCDFGGCGFTDGASSGINSTWWTNFLNAVMFWQNRGPQSPRLRKPGSPRPNPPVTASCVGAALFNNTFGSDSRAEVFLAANILAFVGKQAVGVSLPGPGWVYTGTAIIYDVALVGKSYLDCTHGGPLGGAE